MKQLTKNGLTKLIAGAAGIMALTASSWGQSADALIDKLVEKGILNVKEANQLREETDKGFAQSYAVKSGMPDWVNSVRFGGDIRLRYDHIDGPDQNFVARDRFRYRLRFGWTVSMLDDWEVGVGLTSGANDPISNNQTFDDNGVKKAITIDKAYVKWNPIHDPRWNVSTTLGKMENPIVFPSTMLFDKDYTPEGAAVEVSRRLGDAHTLRATGAAFIMDELGGTYRDPYMFAGQGRWDAQWTKQVQSSIGAAMLTIINSSSLTNGAVPDIGGGNTRSGPTGVLANRFQSLYLDATLGYTFDHGPLYSAPFPVAFVGDYIHNFAAPTDNTGYSLGFNIGKAGKRGLWEINYRFTDFEGDAWYEEVVESDFGAYYKVNAPGTGTSSSTRGYRSGTNIRGHWIKGTYNVLDSLSFAVAYFMTELINEPGTANYNSAANRLFVEAVWKF